MIRTIVQCNSCSTQEDIHLGLFGQATLPGGWLKVEPEGEEPEHYCSKGCLVASMENGDNK